MQRLITILLGLAIAAVTLLTALPPLWPIFPLATSFAPMAPQGAGFGALFALMAFLVRRRKLAALSVIVAAWNLHLIWTDVSPFRAPPPAESQAALKLVSLNLWYDNQNLDRTADYLMASGADVVGLVEATPDSKSALLRLKAVYPYSLDCFDIGLGCQNMLFSKYPLRDTYAGPIDGRYPAIVIASVEMPGGASVRVGVTHVTIPFVRFRAPLLAADPGLPAPRFADAPNLEQSLQAANLAAFLRRQAPDLVLVGDFNSAPWSPLQQAFRAATGLDNRGHFLPSWPTYIWPIFRLPLDPVFVRGRAHVTEIHLGPYVGSDHLPIETEIAIGP
jgi:endonuclease/exonuclease/phosphatase (EEP) superfamily protein YafD